MAEYTIEVNQENRPKGDPIEVPPLGVVENGKTSIVADLTKEQAAYLATGYGITVKGSGGKQVKAADYETIPVDEFGEQIMASAPRLPAPLVEEAEANAPEPVEGGEQA